MRHNMAKVGSDRGIMEALKRYFPTIAKDI